MHFACGGARGIFGGMKHLSETFVALLGAIREEARAIKKKRGLIENRTSLAIVKSCITIDEACTKLEAALLDADGGDAASSEPEQVPVPEQGQEAPAEAEEKPVQGKGKRKAPVKSAD